MTLFISWILTSLVLIATNPTSMTYLALAVVYLIIMRCYLDQGERRHGFCAGLAALLHVILGCIHALA